jgi:hypothetical protein
MEQSSALGAAPHTVSANALQAAIVTGVAPEHTVHEAQVFGLLLVTASWPLIADLVSSMAGVHPLAR